MSKNLNGADRRFDYYDTNILLLKNVPIKVFYGFYRSFDYQTCLYFVRFRFMVSPGVTNWTLIS